MKNQWYGGLKSGWEMKGRMDRDYRLSVALSSEEVGFGNVGSESEPLRRDRREFKRVGGSTGSVWVSSMFDRCGVVDMAG